MNLGQLRGSCRFLLDDAVSPYLWADTTLNAWINEAFREACLRTRILNDSESDFCTVPITAGVNRYEMDKSILQVIRAKLLSLPNDVPLIMTNMDVMDTRYPAWDNVLTRGRPLYGFCNKDYTDHLTLMVAPYPFQNDTLQLSVWRLPTEDEYMDSDSDDCPGPEYFHSDLKYYVASKAFETKDSEAFDPQRSIAMLQKFTDIYGDRPSNHHLKIIGTSRLRGTRAHYF